jgi:hypothetical protein
LLDWSTVLISLESGLGRLTSLTKLDLDSNNISDISPLSGLTNLTNLSLYTNNISDISPLSGLTNLTNLSLYTNNISDISPLSGLTNLTYLRAEANNISDLSALSALTNLTDLSLWGNNISDISPLSGLSNLTWLGLGANNISDISPLSGLTNLTELWLGANNISDISPLSGLTNLTELCLGANNISDISPLSGLTNLTELWLDTNNISDIEALDNAGLGAGGELHVSYNYLNLAAGSDDMQNIQALINRGVEIEYKPQRGTGGNLQPVASAGSDQTLTDTDSNGSERVTLNGSASADPDGSVVSWVWTESGTQIATGETPSITLSVGSHTITLTVTDDAGVTDTDKVSVVVAVPAHTVSAPTAPSGPSSGQVGDSLDFSSGGATCSQGHSVRYRFDWGSRDYSNWSSSTSASHRYSSTGTYQVKAQARCSVVSSVTSEWSEAKTVIIGLPSDKHAPTAAASDITGQPKTMHPDTFYTVTAKYYDADGRDDLDICYLRLKHLSKPLTMMWYEADGHAAPWAGEEGERYITTAYTIFSRIDDGYQITWSFRLNDQWPEAENAIDFGVFASDDSGLSSGDWEYDDANASFILERTGIVTGTVTGTVTDAVTGEGIVGAMLSLDPDPLAYSPVTAHNGQFSFSVPASTYSITASVMDYEPQSRADIAIIAGEWTELNFSLAPKRLPLGEAKFEIGDRVKVVGTGAVGLRLHRDKQGEPAEDVEKVVPNGWLFEITGGPYLTEDHTWWQVKEETYESSPVTNGWVAEVYLTEVAVDGLVPDSPPQYFTLASAQDKVTVALQRALERAKEAKPNWINEKGMTFCLRFVRDVYEGQTSWYSCAVAERDLGTRFYSADTCRNPPEGAMVFFSSPLGEGHVGVYLGNNEVVNIGADGKPHLQSLVEVGKAIGTYRGWAYPPYDWVRYFRIGDKIQTSGAVNVRSRPGQDFPEISHPKYLSVAPAGTSGIVIGGPERTFNADGTTKWIWWRVSFEDGYEGWSIQNRLAQKTDNLN